MITRRPRPARRWHRYLGVVLALPLLVVSLTGVALNHTVGLRLDERLTDWSPVLRHYGMGLEGEPRSHTTGRGATVVTQWGRMGFLDGQPLDDSIDGRQLIGAARVGDQVVLAFETLPMKVHDLEGFLVMRIDDITYPGNGIQRVGSTDEGRLAVLSSEGEAYHFSEDLLECRSGEFGGEVMWSEPIPTPPDLEESMRQAYRGEGVPWSRVLLDLHTGRLFGWLGPWLLDLSVLGLVVLVFTGLKLSRRPPRP